MIKLENITPTPYSNTDTSETRAVSTFKHIIDEDKVKEDIKVRDKFPNNDGYVELVNDLRIPIGKLEVQIKKLPDNFDHKNPKIKIERSLWAYSKTGTANPVLHIGVDIHNDTAYWVHIHDELENIRGVALKDCTNATTLIPLNLNDIDNGIIKKGEDTYVNSWKSISKTHIESVNDHDRLKEQFHELELRSEPTLGEYSDEFVYIHIFLDELNQKLGYFDLIKSRFYFKDTWKLGLAYNVFSDNGLRYAIFPIPFNKNDVQIKRLIPNEDILIELKQFGSPITHHFGSNPIKDDPGGYAKKIIESKIEKILDKRLLIPCNELIAKEIVFAVFDNSYALNRDTYSIEEIKNIVNETKIVNKQSYEFFSFSTFVDSIKFLESKGLKYINRDYISPDYERNYEEEWNYNSLSYESAKKNLEMIFNNLPTVYNDILSCNFQKIANKLPIFQGASKVIASYSLKDRYKSLEDYPRLFFFYLESDEHEDFEIRLFDQEKSHSTSRI